jgi:hypothetical protein
MAEEPWQKNARRKALLPWPFGLASKTNMKKNIIPLIMLISMTIFSCQKEVILSRPFHVDTTLTLPPGQTEYCLQNVGEFYKYVWGLQYGPAAACPYYSYANKSCQVNFTDGSSIVCGTTQYAIGVSATGGVSLQNQSCNTLINGFFTYILLNYYPISGGQAVATFPLYGCYSLIGNPIGSTLYPISIIKNNITYILHTTNADFSYPISYPYSRIVTKTIKSINI